MQQPSWPLLVNSKQMQIQLTQPVVRYTRTKAVDHPQPTYATGNDLFPKEDAKTAYAAFLALSALRSRLLLAASGPLSVSQSQSHQVKELE